MAALDGDLASAAKVNSSSAFKLIWIEQVTSPNSKNSGAHAGFSHKARRDISSFSAKHGTQSDERSYFTSWAFFFSNFQFPFENVK